MDFWRQTDIVDSRKLGDLAVTLVGAGGIGCPTGLSLARMGIGEMHVYDDDVLAVHNLPSTMYPKIGLDNAKVLTLANMIREFGDTKVHAHQYRMNGDQTNLNPGVVISGVDSMKSRQDIWEHVRMKPQIQLYIDARMAGQHCQILTVNPTNPKSIKFYEERLTGDENVPDAPCTNRAIIYNTFMIASLICWQVRNYVMNEELPAEIFFDFISRQWLISKELA